MGPSSVAGDLEAIFATAAPAAASPGPSSKVRAVGGARRRWSYASLGAVAAAGLVGLTAGSAFMGGRAKPATPTKPAPQPQTLAVQVAAPTVTLSTVHPGPIPVLDNEPVAETAAVRPAGLRRVHASVRAHAPSDLMTADRRLRTAYSHAVRAGVPRHVLVTYRDRWEGLRQDAAWRPARVAAGYGAMSADLERLARRSHGRRAPQRHFLFGLFS